jgi:CheY-like chemotaxis protein
MGTAAQLFLVEDDEAIRESLTQVLEEAGYTVACAENGAEALTMLRDGRPVPDLIILDLMMPIMDGFAFCEDKAGDARLRPVPVLIMSAAGQAEAALKRTGAQGYLRKPMTLEAILEAVRKHTA